MIGSEGSYVRMVTPPERWDEILDTKLPILIENRPLQGKGFGDWGQFSQELTVAGLSSRYPIWLTQESLIQSVEIREQVLHPKPQGEHWSLTILPSEPSTAIPLSDLHLVLLRARDQNRELAITLHQLGARVSCLPMLEFVEPDDRAPLTRALDNLVDYDAVLFTSRNGVAHFFEEMETCGTDTQVLADKTLAAIGPGTEASLATRGWEADLVANTNLAEGLVDCIKSRNPDGIQGKRFLLPRAQVARDHICEELRKLGASVDDVPVYKTVAPAYHESQFEDIGTQSVLVVTSSSTVKHWAAATQRRPQCVCIGPVCSGTARELGFPVLATASQHNFSGLVEIICSELGKTL